MAGKPRETRRDTLTVSVDECRVRVQTGEETVFIDAREADDRARSGVQVVGSIRHSTDDRLAHPPCHKHNYIVVYCG
jgi:hypothetical protein